MRLNTSTVLSDLEEAGMDAHIVEDGENLPYLHVEGKSYGLDVEFGTDVDDTLDLDYVLRATLYSLHVDRWNHYNRTDDFRHVDTLEGFTAAVDALTR